MTDKRLMFADWDRSCFGYSS